MTSKKKPQAPMRPEIDAQPRRLEVVLRPNETESQAMGRLACDPGTSAGTVMQAFQGHHLGDDVSLMSMIGSINAATDRVKAGDLSDLEGMLVAQATALQTMFVSLARRAQGQQYQRNLEAYMGLALKAQAQSRATITALVDLKYPRTTVIAKQANVANGPQQVNNGSFETNTHACDARGAEKQSSKIKELEVSNGQWLDAGTSRASGGTDSLMAAVGEGDRSKND